MNGLSWAAMNPKTPTLGTRLNSWLMSDANQAALLIGFLIMVACAVGVSL